MDDICKSVCNIFINLWIEKFKSRRISYRNRFIFKNVKFSLFILFFIIPNITFARIGLGENAQAMGAQSTALGDEAKAFGPQTVAIGANSEALGYAGVAIGGDDIINTTAAGRAERAKFLSVTDEVLSVRYRSTTASGTASLALGATASAQGAFSTALGVNATATGFAGLALGIQSTASADGALAMGAASAARGDNTVALGASSQATTMNATAIGVFSAALTDGATAVGKHSMASGSSSLAVGMHSTATSNSSIAIGSNARTDIDNSIALGASSKTVAQVGDSFLTNIAASNTNGVVSVGNDRLLRRIQNVADGAQDQDAVTVAQLKVLNNKFNQTSEILDSKIGQLKRDLDQELNTTNNRINQLSKEANAGVAAAIAIAALAQPTEKGYTMLAIGGGAWEGETGFSVGASGVTNDKKILNKPVNYIWKFASTTNSQGKWGGGASIGVQWR